MAVKKILRMGHPLLRQHSRPMQEKEILEESTKELIQDMIDTMNAEEGIGLAAPQIGVLKQIALIGISPENPRYPETHETELITVINPKITILGEQTQAHWEGCLSVPGLRGLVERPKHIQVDFLDEKAQKQSLELNNFLSTVFQHEIDHLFGTLYIDKVKDTTKIAYLDEFIEHWTKSDSD